MRSLFVNFIKTPFVRMAHFYTWSCDQYCAFCEAQNDRRFNRRSFFFASLCYVQGVMGYITLQQEIEVQEQQNENIEKFIQRAQKYVGIEELDPYALRSLYRRSMWMRRTNPVASAGNTFISSMMAWCSSR